jgi:hypothetical protein
MKSQRNATTFYKLFKIAKPGADPGGLRTGPPAFPYAPVRVVAPR